MAVKTINISEHRLRGHRALASELAEALRKLGGAAHLGMLTQVVAADRRRRGVKVELSLARTVQTVLAKHEAVGGNNDEALFFRPFGPDSQRWALRNNPSNVIDLPSRIAVEVEAILEDNGVQPNSADGIDGARRRVIEVLSSGETCSTVDVTILDELERRSRLARLQTRH